jgi:Protein of unknown function (DUF732)
MRRTVLQVAAALLAAGVLAGCGSAPPPTPYQRYVASMAAVGLHPVHGQAAEMAWAKGICGRLASAVETYPQDENVAVPAAVTDAEKKGYTEAQAAALMHAVIDDFCPQWKVLLRQ